MRRVLNRLCFQSAVVIGSAATGLAPCRQVCGNRLRVEDLARLLTRFAGKSVDEAQSINPRTLRRSGGETGLGSSCLADRTSHALPLCMKADLRSGRPKANQAA